MVQTVRLMFALNDGQLVDIWAAKDTVMRFKGREQDIRLNYSMGNNYENRRRTGSVRVNGNCRGDWCCTAAAATIDFDWR